MSDEWDKLTPKEKQYAIIGVGILIIFIAIIAVVDPFNLFGSEETSGDSLRARFTSWVENYNEVRSDFNSLLQSWADGEISNSTFYSSSEIYYDDSFTGKFQELESRLWLIDDDAFGTEWDSYSQKMIEGIALWNNSVFYAREYARTGDESWLSLATNSIEDSEDKFNQAMSLMP